MLAAVGVVAALVVAALAGGGGEGGGGTQQSPRQGDAKGTGQQATAGESPQRGVAVRLTATAEVWVCVLGAGGRHLVDGQILEEGAEEGPFRSGSFTVSFGNGEISMLIDGTQADIPATSSPVGYAIDASGELTELPEGERPTCL